MPESAEELSQHPDVREALEQTAGKKAPSRADKSDKFGFIAHLLLLLGCGVLYFLLGSRYVPLPKAHIDLVHRLLRGAAIIIVLFAISMRSRSTRLRGSPIPRLVSR